MDFCSNKSMRCSKNVSCMTVISRSDVGDFWLLVLNKKNDFDMVIGQPVVSDDICMYSDRDLLEC